MFLVFALRYQSFPPQIPLFYSHAAGEDQLGEWWMIFLFPLFMNLFIMFNSFFARKFFFENVFVSKMLQYFNVFLMISMTLLFMKLVFLVS